MKGIRSLEMGKASLLFEDAVCGAEDDDGLRQRLLTPNDRRMWALFEALDRGWSTARSARVDEHRPVVPRAVRRPVGAPRGADGPGDCRPGAGRTAGT